MPAPLTLTTLAPWEGSSLSVLHIWLHPPALTLPSRLDFSCPCPPILLGPRGFGTLVYLQPFDTAFFLWPRDPELFCLTSSAWWCIYRGLSRAVEHPDHGRIHGPGHSCHSGFLCPSLPPTVLGLLCFLGRGIRLKQALQDQGQHRASR